MATLTGSISNHPVSYDSDRQWNSASATANGYTDSSSTNYCQVNLTFGSQAETMVNWNFGSFAAIPEGATIDSVTCTCKCMINNTTASRIAIRTAQLYSGSTAKGTAYTVANSTTVFDITPGTWTREELLSAKLRLYAKRGTSSTGTGYYFRFYGATMTVEYSYEGASYNLKVKNNGSWVTPTKVLVKDEGTWKEASGIKAKSGGAWHR